MKMDTDIKVEEVKRGYNRMMMRGKGKRQKRWKVQKG
jgi:hypothetical protein